MMADNSVSRTLLHPLTGTGGGDDAFDTAVANPSNENCRRYLTTRAEIAHIDFGDALTDELGGALVDATYMQFYTWFLLNACDASVHVVAALASIMMRRVREFRALGLGASEIRVAHRRVPLVLAQAEIQKLRHAKLVRWWAASWVALCRSLVCSCPDTDGAHDADACRAAAVAAVALCDWKNENLRKYLNYFGPLAVPHMEQLSRCQRVEPCVSYLQALPEEKVRASGLCCICHIHPAPDCA